MSDDDLLLIAERDVVRLRTDLAEAERKVRGLKRGRDFWHPSLGRRCEATNRYGEQCRQSVSPNSPAPFCGHHRRSRLTLVREPISTP